MAKVAERLAVLGQVVRLRLVEQLADGSATPQELADALGLTQQNVSKHLQILYRSGVVSRRPEGANVIYSLSDESTVRLLDDVVASVAEHLRELSALASGIPDEGGTGKTGNASSGRRGEASGR
jgi:DNA-binding transcriptional ArsR family regulator